MKQTKMVRVTKKRDVRIHGFLWHTSDFLLEAGIATERGSNHQFRGSLVFTAFTLEAYLNWLGSRLIPHWDYLVRLSPKEKLQLLTQHIGVAADFSKPPWQVVKELFGFRNDIAHGKPIVLTNETLEPNDEHLDMKLEITLETRWEKFCTKDNAKKARADIQHIIETIHRAANLKNEFGPFSSGFQLHGASLEATEDKSGE